MERMILTARVTEPTHRLLSEFGWAGIVLLSLVAAFNGSPWLIALPVGCAVLTILFWLWTQRELALVERDGRQVLLLDGEPILRGPFVSDLAWEWVREPGGLSARRLQVAFREGPSVRLLLIEQWSFFWPSPWPAGRPRSEAEVVLTAASWSFLVPLVRAIERRS